LPLRRLSDIKTTVDNPEQKARATIDDMPDKAGWRVQDAAHVNLAASRGVAIHEFPPWRAS
jgi:hypothetical protein